MKTLLPLLFLFATINLTAQAGLQDKIAVANHADQVMQLFGTSQFDQAFEVLRPFYPVSEIDYQNIKVKTAQNLQQAEEGYGSITGEVFIKEQNLKDIAIRRYYVVKLETILLKFSLVYYKGKDGWIVNSFSWNNEFEVLFE